MLKTTDAVNYRDCRQKCKTDTDCKFYNFSYSWMCLMLKEAWEVRKEEDWYAGHVAGHCINR